MNLEGKVAVVTGSGRGIGRSYALALAQAGCAVVVNDVDGDVAEATADEIANAGGRVIAEVCAVGSAEAADQLVSGAVNAFGHLDIMCTNAGILRDRVLWNMSDDDFDVVIETHLRGHLHLRAGGGSPDARAGDRRTDRRGLVDRGTARQLRADQLRGGEGRDRRIRPHLGDGMREAQHHRQRDRSQRDHPDDLDDSRYGAAGRGGREGRATSGDGAQADGHGHARRRGARCSCS